MKHPLTSFAHLAAALAATLPAVPAAAFEAALDGAAASFSFAASDSPRALYGAFDERDRGASTNGWALVEPIATVPAGATELSGVALPPEFFAGLPVMRAFLEEPKTAADYVQDGLVLLYDGRENAGWGEHDDAAATWRNLVAEGGDTDTDMPLSETGDAVGADFVSFAASSRATPGDLLSAQPAALTVEANARPTWKNAADANNMTLVRVGSCGGIAFEHKAPFSVWNRYSDDNAFWYIRGFGSGFTATELVESGSFHTYSAAIGMQDDVSAFIDGETAAYNKDVYSKDNANRARGDRLDVQMGEMNKKARFDVRSMRVYSRKLTAEEVAANVAVDAARFEGRATFEAGAPLFAPVPFKVVSAKEDGSRLLAASLRFPASAAVRRLRVAWASRDAGESFSAWANAATVCDVPAGVAALDADLSAAGLSVPAGAGVRFFLDATTAADYVQDGLVLLYDGRENAGWGEHDDAAATWRNLVAEGGDTDTDMPLSETGDAVGADFVSFAASSRATPGDLLSAQPAALTVEANARPTWKNAADANNMTLVRVGSCGGIAFEHKAPFSVWNRYSDDNAFWYICGFGAGFTATELVESGAFHTYSAAIGMQDDVSAFIDGETAAYNKDVYSKDNANRARGDRLDVQMGEMNKKARFDVRSVRVYSRKLSAEEVAANVAVDAARFEGGAPVRVDAVSGFFRKALATVFIVR